MKRILPLFILLIFLTAQPVYAESALQTVVSRPRTKVPTYAMLEIAHQEWQKPFDELPLAEHPETLPKRVDFRDNTGSFTRYLEACLRDGIIYIRHRDSGEEWRECPMPADLKGKVVAISMDADELVALDKDNWIYLLSKLFKDSSEWKWSTAWGEVFGFGRGYQLPQSGNGKWALSNIDAGTDKTYLDGDGRSQPVGITGCTQIFYVDPYDDANILYADPWLPGDLSRAMGSPNHSRFRIRSLSSSASVTFVINQYGDMYTRCFDYDIGGSDPMFFHYTWEKVPDEAVSADVWLKHFFDRSTADIRLPAPYWQHQPAIPGEITDRISIETTDAGMQNRRLKVEGTSEGKTGYWTKLLTEPSWSFVETGEPLQGKLLNYTGAEDLKPPTGIHYAGTLGDYSVEVRDFAYNDSRQTVVLTDKNGNKTEATLCYEYGNKGSVLNQTITHREYGLNDVPRYYVAALYVGDKVYTYGMEATQSQIVLEGDEMSGTLKRTS